MKKDKKEHTIVVNIAIYIAIATLFCISVLSLVFADYPHDIFGVTVHSWTEAFRALLPIYLLVYGIAILANTLVVVIKYILWKNNNNSNIVK